MTYRRNVPFKITSIDSLGQGVSKASDKITFIPKTAVGDEGEAEILAEKKGVAFGRMVNLTRRSTDRQEPSCPHFSSCPSCHYQHVSYETELSFKRDALTRLLSKLNAPPLEVIGSPRRLEYRNRIQLHYDRKKGLLGMLDAKSNSILPVPECQIALPEILEELRRLYRGNSWLSEAPANLPKGHVEIYLRDGSLMTTWNKPYAEGGFTQVFSEMNEALRERLTRWRGPAPSKDLLDLFAGNGNLSDKLPRKGRLAVDFYRNLPGSDFYSQDLYSGTALKEVQRQLSLRGLKPSVLLLDPPRSGLKDLANWTNALEPEHIAYVSCDPHTMVRDLVSLTGYEIREAVLLDLFPSTFHFESLLLLERKSC